MLEQQLIQLNDEIKEITSEIQKLYARLDSEADPLGKEKLEERIAELKREKTEVNDRRRKLEDKLQPGGMPPKAEDWHSLNQPFIEEARLATVCKHLEIA